MQQFSTCASLTNATSRYTKQSLQTHRSGSLPDRHGKLAEEAEPPGERDQSSNVDHRLLCALKEPSTRWAGGLLLQDHEPLPRRPRLSRVSLSCRPRTEITRLFATREELSQKPATKRPLETLRLFLNYLIEFKLAQ